MSREIGRDRDSLMSVCTLPADARVAEFLRYWAESLARRGLRTDQITLRMTRAEIGNYLGMTLETVSRALSKLARDKVIEFAEKGRRDVRIPNVEALSALRPALPVAGADAAVASRARGSVRAPTRRARSAIAARQLLAAAGLAQQLPGRRRVAIGIEQLGREARHQQDRQSPASARCARAASSVPRMPAPSAMSVSSRSNAASGVSASSACSAAGRLGHPAAEPSRKLRMTARTSASSSTSSTRSPAGTACAGAGVARLRRRPLPAARDDRA